MVVASILLSMAVPSMRAGVARSRLEGAANELSMDLYHARSEALRRRTSVAVAVNADLNGYTLCDFDLSASRCPDGSSFKTVRLPADVLLTEEAQLVFDGLRGATGGDTSFALRSLADGGRLTASVTTLGRVRLCTPNRGYAGFPSC